MLYEHTVNYDELAQTWRNVALNAAHIPGQPTDILREVWQNVGFSGASVAEMLDRVDNGFTVPGLKLQAGTQTRPRRKLRWDEEGELQVEVALQGHDQPFLLHKARPRTPGVKVVIEFGARSTVPAAVIAAHTEWVAQMLAGLGDRGYDLEINIHNRAAMSFGTVGFNVRVKRFGRKSSLKSWGALFSPSGFRMLGFTARMLACSVHHQACDPTMGGSMSTGWGVNFDPKARTLTIGCHHNAKSFPAELMTAQLAAVKF